MSAQRVLAVLGACVAMALVLALHAAQASAADRVNVPAETEAVRDLLERAMRAYRLADFQTAYKLARAAYLDHFELVEIPLRVVDADLTLDMEYRFADLRTKLQAGAPVLEVDRTVRAVRDGLNEIDAMFSNLGTLAPALAFGSSFTIIFREGLEAVLVIAALLGYLQTGPGRSGGRHVLLGAGLALITTAVTWGVLRFVVQIAPGGRELLEAIVSLLAVIVLFWVSFWLLNRLDRQRWMEFLRARASAAMASGSALGLLGLGFTAVYREGFETALFYEVLLSISRRSETFVLYGFLAGAAALGAVAWMILRAGRRLPVRVFLNIAVGITMLLSIAFIGKAVRELQETGLLDATSLIGVVPRLPRAVAEFTGIHPTVQTLSAQAGLLCVYLAGGVLMWWKSHRTSAAPARAREAS